MIDLLDLQKHFILTHLKEGDVAVDRRQRLLL